MLGKLDKRIVEIKDVQEWKRSKAHQILSSFLATVNDAVKGKRIPEAPCTSLAENLLATLQAVRQIIKQNPPQPVGKTQRYGNPSFRAFYTQLEREIPALLQVSLAAIISQDKKAAEELGPYLLNSFGSPVRLDYGTGHELSFLGFLAATNQLSPYNDADLRAVGLLVMEKYLEIAQQLQKSYSLEPAGSHGVWGLDDYQFIPYIWGSSQLIDQSEIDPHAITIPSTVSQHKSDYLYLQAIDYITSIKKGRSFGEHSPILYDISAITTWSRINAGLLKMYREEVMGKFPVVQHFLFGSLLPWEQQS